MKIFFTLLLYLGILPAFATVYSTDQGAVSLNGGTHSISACGCTITFTSLSVKNSASLTVPAGVTLVITGKFENKTTSTVVVNGELDLQGLNNDNKSGGDITGSGNISTPPSAPLVNSGGTIFGSSETTIDCSTGECQNGTLPVELTSFKATANDHGVIVEWQTASEINNDYFTLEKSYDGVNFTTIATVTGAGNSSEIINYQIQDYQEAYSRLYYKLTQTDFDGKFETFPLISFYYENPNGLDPLIYPTMLTSDTRTIHMTNVWGSVEQAEINLYDLKGAMWPISHTISSNELRISLDTQNTFEPGYYILKGLINGSVISERIVYTK